MFRQYMCTHAAVSWLGLMRGDGGRRGSDAKQQQYRQQKYRQNMTEGR